MLRKAFQPPLLKRAPSQTQDNTTIAPPPKRLKPCLSEEDTECENSTAHLGHVTVDYREPLAQLENATNAGKESYYEVLWRKPSNKKHKTWDGDGLLSVINGQAQLRDDSGKELGRIKCDQPLLLDSTISISGKEIQVESVLKKDEYLARLPSAKKSAPSLTSTTSLKPNAALLSSLRASASPIPRASPKPAIQEITAESFYRPLHAVASQTMQRQFKDPTISKTVLAKPENSEVTPRHDPKRADALVMTRPSIVPKGERVVDVVVDPILCKRLRKHQREGVSFMYECVMGMRPFDGQGALLADEMGMGKTLQTIALIWTLLKQNPVYEAPPVIKKALIVCPVTLINNWKKEFRKWLGSERVGVFVADGTHNRLRDFTMGKSYSVMIIGYEKLRTVYEELNKGSGIDLVVADEGHRLKTAKNKSAEAIRNLNTPRRIILSGTPIQNDLSEFFTMVDFINPGLLKSYNSFRKNYESPILHSRQPGATPDDLERGELASIELSELTSHFILRRTADLLAEYLPPKTEYVLFCKPTTAQIEVYRHVLQSPSFNKVLGSPEASLQLITLLKKVCNSPTLLNSSSVTASRTASQAVTQLLTSIPPALLRTHPNSPSSAKLRVLSRLLHHIRHTTSEKVVLISSFTSTLTLLQTHLATHAYPFLRLDGSTPPAKRQDLVDTFNRTPASTCFAFLLSAKAGGVGLNLTGASRVVLFEVDWNPSTDLQAMARVHRDGQKKEVRIYRLVVAGALDERVWQRQVSKMGLADSVVDGKRGGSTFSEEELRDLFRLDTGGGCRTHELLDCGCKTDGSTPMPSTLEDKPEILIDSHDPTTDSTATLANALPTKGFTKASNIYDGTRRPEPTTEIEPGAIQESSNDETKKGRQEKGMQSLMAYSHIDTSHFGDPAIPKAQRTGNITDEVLLTVLREESNRISFIFAKTSSKGSEVEMTVAGDPVD